MEKIILKANAKINLTLDCLKKRDDGYHNLEMVMCEIPLYDVVTLEKRDTISVKTNTEFLPENRKNIAYRAAEEFFLYTNIVGGVKINIEKNIPICAGLAGGSTDGAAVIKGLNQIYKTKLTEEEMCKIGDNVGKDIPFCIKGGVCLAKGTGEKLTPLKKLPDCFLVLVKPDNINVSTAEIFTEFDNIKNELHPHTDGVVECLEKGDLKGVAHRMYNVLESVTVKMHPVIEDIKSELLEFGALGSVMSGSGPTVFGIFENRVNAQNAVSHFKNKYNQSYFLEMV